MAAYYGYCIFAFNILLSNIEAVAISASVGIQNQINIL
jgi:hypothetical protein